MNRPKRMASYQYPGMMATKKRKLSLPCKRGQHGHCFSDGCLCRDKTCACQFNPRMP